jgi:hypothetical protein
MAHIAEIQILDLRKRVSSFHSQHSNKHENENCLTVTNTLAYYAMAHIARLQNFNVQAHYIKVSSFQLHCSIN